MGGEDAKLHEFLSWAFDGDELSALLFDLLNPVSNFILPGTLVNERDGTE
jgi:hypothetical protein